MQMAEARASGGRPVDVVIVGAGPVGLMLAIELRSAGVEVVVLEGRAHGTVGESRAPGISARTLELFRQRGMGAAFTAQGKPLTFVVFGGIPMDPHEQDPDWPDGWILPQHDTERILAARAVELGARILWSTPFTAVSTTPDGVEVTCGGEDGTTTISASYLVGCDGGHSAVRSAAEIPFPGVAPEAWWVVGDLRLADPPDAAQPFGFNDRVGRYQLSQAEPGWFRLNMLRLAPPLDPARPVTLDEVRQTMLQGIGTDHGLTGARWLSRWSDGFRHAAEYRAGRVFLAGDAAHTHTPVGGQGLNTGVQDAVNLGWKLAAVLHGTAPDSLLDSYHDERWPIAAEVLTQSMAQTELVKPGPRLAAIRAIFEDLLALPDTARHLAGELSGLGIRYPLGEGHPLLGRRMPDLTLLVDGETTTVLTLLQTAGPLLLTLTADANAQLSDMVGSWAGMLEQIPGQYEPDRRSDGWHMPVFGAVPPFDAVLIRPDGYVSWIKPAPQAADLDALTTAVTHRVASARSTAVAANEDVVWDIRFTTPRGEQSAKLTLRAGADGRTGTYNGEPVQSLEVTDTTIAFTCRIRQPFPTTVRWRGRIQDAAISGTAKTSFMTLPFTATRR